MPDAAQINIGINQAKLVADVEAALRRIEQRGLNLRFGRGGGGLGPQGLGTISEQANEFEKSLKAAEARVLAFGATAGQVYLFARAMKEVVRVTIDVEKSLADINVILGASSKNLKRFGDDLFTIAKNTGQSFKTVAQAATEFSRQGLGLEETLRRTRDALILTRLSGLEVVDSTESITAALNSFNETILTSTDLVNKFARVDANFAVSSADLAEALKRVGSTAQEAGVSIDELIALVTSAQQTTARGGSVIGNALKTIFQRIERPAVIQQFKAFGIAVEDANENLLPAQQILINVAKAYDTLNRSQQVQITQLAAGVYQANIFKSLLNDLAKGSLSVYSNALRDSTSATDEAISRNQELNRTLASSLNELKANVTQAVSNIGQLSISPLLEKLFSIGNGFANAFTDNSSLLGQTIGEGILKGLGSFLSGPGLAGVLVIATRLFGKFVSFGLEALKTLLSYNTYLTEQRGIESSINQVLLQRPDILYQIRAGTITQIELESKLLDIIRTQNALRAGTVFSFTSSSQRSGRVPNFASPIEDAVSREKRAGVPGNLIRLGSSKRLIDARNPLGLGIYNLRDEPFGLEQGISRVLSLGGNPKYYRGGAGGGIPSFADDIKVESTVFGQEILTKQLQPEIIKLRDQFRRGVKTYADLEIEAKRLQQVFSLTNASFRNIISSLTYAYNQRPGTLTTQGAVANLRYPVQPPGTLDIVKNIPPTKQIYPPPLALPFGPQRLLLGPGTSGFNTFPTGSYLQGAQDVDLRTRLNYATSLGFISTPGGLLPSREADLYRTLFGVSNATAASVLSPKLPGGREGKRLVRDQLIYDLSQGKPFSVAGPTLGPISLYSESPRETAKKRLLELQAAGLPFSIRGPTQTFALPSNLLKTQEYLGVSPAQQAATVAAIRNQQALEALSGPGRPAPSIIPGLVTQAQGRFGFGFGRRATSALADLDRLNPQVADEVRRNISNRYQNFGLIGGIGAPLLAGSISTLFDETTKSGRVGAAVTTGLGQAVSYGAIGATLFGKTPQTALAAAGIGAAAGVVDTLIRVFRALSDVGQRFRNELDQTTERLNRANEGIAQFSATSTQLSNIFGGGVKATPQQVLNIRSQQAIALSQIGSRGAGELLNALQGGDPVAITATQESIRFRLTQEQNIAKLKDNIDKSIASKKVDSQTLNGIIEGILSLPGSRAATLIEQQFNNPTQVAATRKIGTYRSKAFIGPARPIDVLTQAGLRQDVIAELSAAFEGIEKNSGLAEAFTKEFADRINRVLPELKKIQENLKNVSENIKPNEFRQFLNKITRDIYISTGLSYGEQSLVNRSNISDVGGLNIGLLRAQGQFNRNRTLNLLSPEEILRYQFNIDQQRLTGEAGNLSRAGYRAFGGKINQFGISGLLGIQSAIQSSRVVTPGNVNDLLALQRLQNVLDKYAEQSKSGALDVGGLEKLLKTELSNVEKNFSQEYASKIQENIRSLFEAVLEEKVKQDEISSKLKSDIKELETKYTEDILERSLNTVTGILDRFGRGRLSGRGTLRELEREVATQRGLPGYGGQQSLQNAGLLFRGALSYNSQDFFEDIENGAIDAAQTFRSEFSQAFKDFASGAKSAKDAFTDFALNLASAIQGKIIDLGINSLFGKLFGGIGNVTNSLITGSTGGLISGGSGIRDDVPALLTSGEYVIRKDAVNALGTDFFDAINSSANIRLTNQYDYNDPRRPTAGAANVSPFLSAYALEDENNPQNRLRIQREEAFLRYIADFEAYNQNKQQAMAAFRKQKFNMLLGTYISAGLGFASPFLSGAGRGGSNISSIPPAQTPLNLGLAYGGTVVGGDSSRDSIPALLKEGEYVLNRQAVSRIGTSNLDALNYGVGRSGSRQSGSSSLLERLIESNERLNNTLSNINQQNGQLAGGTQSPVNVNMTFNIDKNGNISSEQQKSENQNQDIEKNRRFGEAIRVVVVDEIVKNLRPGGLLYGA